jgi:hypothetical protein
MSAGISRIMLASVLTTTLLLLTGCNDPPVRDQTRPSRPAAFLPEQFPDIPLPPGYMLSPDSDQLAVSLAGGSVRRFEVSLERRPNSTAQTATALLAFVKRDLGDHGWQLTDANEASQHWHKGNEDLLVETGRTDSRTTIRYRLRPAATSTP